MIYDFPPVSDPIRQGDIFVNLPRPDFSLGKILKLVGDAGETEEIHWSEAATENGGIEAVVSLMPVSAIVITQDCDNIRSHDISLCEIGQFRVIEGKAKETSAPNSWVNIITQHARINQKWFYLPPETKIPFAEKMAVSFSQTIRLPRVDLESLRSFRKARLNDIAEAHFRERIAEFFRRYPYDEWYALSKEELAAYQKAYPEAQPKPWQK
jgi:hypothetical protein